ncbi:MAG: hypothetical protein IPJ37_17855 [Bacteroidales bacterium]|nr:hypothetical protein [Bacteroidales bacterium]
MRTITAPYGDPMLSRESSRNEKGGYFPGKHCKIFSDWDKAMEEYGQRVKEDAEFAVRWGDAGPIYGNNGGDGNILITTKRVC